MAKRTVSRKHRMAVYSEDVIKLLLAHQHKHRWYRYRNVREIDPDESESMGMVPGHCFSNALYYAGWHDDSNVRGWQVIIGYAESDGREPLAHAWVVDPYGQAWDPTWFELDEVRYVGMPLRKEGP